MTDVESHLSREMVRRLSLVLDLADVDNFGFDEFKTLAQALLDEGVATSYSDLTADSIQRIYDSVFDAWALMVSPVAGRA